MLSCERTPVCYKRRHLTLTDIFVISNIHRLRCQVSVSGGKNFRKFGKACRGGGKGLPLRDLCGFYARSVACGMMPGPAPRS